MTTLLKKLLLVPVCLLLMAVSFNACTEKDLPEITNVTPTILKNAGIVLVAPYLPRLFSMVGYLNGTGDFTNDNARARAVFLIQYLVTQDNDREYSEQDLFLNQLLVNYPDSLSLPNYIELTDEEVKSAEDLLEGAKANWKEIKGSSVESLRELFLMRAGRLESREGGWLVTVEKRAFDTLLSSLPWSITYIKFSWNPHHIDVIWP